MKIFSSFFYVLFFASVVILQVSADPITIYNLTHDDLWLATYYTDSEAADRVGGVLKAIKQTAVQIDRPAWCLRRTRELAYAYDKNSLAKRLDAVDWQRAMSRNISGLQGSEFTIVKKNGIYQVYNRLQWILEKPFWEGMQAIADLVTNPFEHLMKIDNLAIAENPYHDTQAVVRVGNELCSDEKVFLKKRAPVVQAALEKMLGESLKGKYIPKISIVGSGGGYRAMFCTTGSLDGAQQINLLDATTYLSALSGSTWAVSTWFATGLPIKQFRRLLIEKASRGLHEISFQEMELIGESLKAKIAFEQPLSLIDLYGHLLGTVLLSDFGDARHRVYLSHQADRVADGKWPYPIYTAVRAEEGAASEWYEFTPHEIGGSWLKRYTPTWAFGRQFVEGYSVDFAPEQSLGFLMGIWGSAFGANVAQIYEAIYAKINFSLTHEIIEKVLLSAVGDDRITYGEVYNFVAGMRKPITQQEILEMVDAGAAPGFNLPYPPISGERPERKADIIIFLDSSASVKDGEVLKEVEAYARTHNLKFPQIRYRGIDSKAISIFKDLHDPEVPVVIYMPRINDPLLWAALNKPEYAHYAPYIRNFDIEYCVNHDCCNTMNFEYDYEEAMRLTKLTEFNMIMSKDAIAEAIRWVINNKSYPTSAKC